MARRARDRRRRRKGPAPRTHGRYKARAAKAPDGKSPHWLWRVEWTEQGKRRTSSLNRIPEGQVDQAFRAWLDARTDDGLATVSGPITCAQALDHHAGVVRARPGVAAATAANVRRSCVVLAELLGGVAIQRLTLRHTRAVQAQLAKRYAPSTVNERMVTLRAAWGTLRADGLVPDRDLPMPKPLKVEGKDKVYVDHVPTEAEVWRVLRDPKLGDFDRLMVALLFSTGCRATEIGCATWADLDRSRSRWWLEVGNHAESCKTGARRVPVQGVGRSALEELVAEGNDADPAQRITGRAWDACRHRTRALAASCARTSQPRWTFKALRKLVSTQLIEAGTNPKLYEEIMGHSYATGLRWYAQVRGSAVDADRGIAGLGAAAPEEVDNVLSLDIVNRPR